MRVKQPMSKKGASPEYDWCIIERGQEAERGNPGQTGFSKSKGKAFMAGIAGGFTTSHIPTVGGVAAKGRGPAPALTENRSSQTMRMAGKMPSPQPRGDEMYILF